MRVKKNIFVIICVVSIYFIICLINKFNCKAEYIYSNLGHIDGIRYGDTIYREFDYIHDWYSLVENEDLSSSKKIYIKSNDYTDFILPFDYFVFLNSNLDDFSNFIVEQPFDSSINQVYVKNSFVLPTLNRSEVDEVWMSLSSTDEDNIKDINMVNHIVECAKSNGELSLDKEVYEQIKSTSWDNHCFYLKYKGYPLVEEFHIEETEDGRYIVDQYTASEYDSIYLEEHK